MKCDVINDVKLFDSILQHILLLLSQIFDVIQSDFTLQKQVHYKWQYMILDEAQAIKSSSR